MHAVILAGGKGVRLRPYTTALPKPLVPIGDSHSILEIVLHQFAAYGFTSVTLAINHLGPLIRAFVGDGSRWGLEVEYVEETIPLSTVGPLFGLQGPAARALPRDERRRPDRPQLRPPAARAPAASGAALTVATAPRTTKIDFGVLEVEDGRIVGFNEKPALTHRVSMGVYGMSRETLEPYPAGLAVRLRPAGAGPLGRGDPPATLPVRRLLARHRPARRLRRGQPALRQPAAVLLPDRARTGRPA